MRPRFLYRTRLFPVIVTAVAIGLLWALTEVGLLEKAASTLVGAFVGVLCGHSLWNQVRKRIDASNRVTLYYTDTLMYAFVVAVGIASLAPLPSLRAAVLLAQYPAILVVVVLGIFSVGLTMSLTTYWLIRRHELQHGPLNVKWQYAVSTTGAEGMIGRTAVVVAVRATEGTVRVGSELWRARPLNDFILRVGETVLIREVNGLCLLVEHTAAAVA